MNNFILNLGSINLNFSTTKINVLSFIRILIIDNSILIILIIESDCHVLWHEKILVMTNNIYFNEKLTPQADEIGLKTFE